MNYSGMAGCYESQQKVVSKSLSGGQRLRMWVYIVSPNCESRDIGRERGRYVERTT